MPIEVSGDPLAMSTDWKKISKHVHRIKPAVSLACEDAIREVLATEGSEADAAIASIADSAEAAGEEGSRASDSEER